MLKFFWFFNSSSFQVRFFGQQGGNLSDFIRISAARSSDTAGLPSQE
jgi:hypothetical protein